MSWKPSPCAHDHAGGVFGPPVPGRIRGIRAFPHIGGLSRLFKSPSYAVLIEKCQLIASNYNGMREIKNGIY